LQYTLPALPPLERLAMTEDDSSNGSRRASSTMGQIMPLVGTSSAVPSARGSIESSPEGSMAHRVTVEYEWPPKAHKGKVSKASSPQHALGRSLGVALQDTDQSNGYGDGPARATSKSEEVRAEQTLSVEEESGCCCVIN